MFVDELGLNLSPPVNFWTEASLFSEAGYQAIVFGPGNIADAHQPCLLYTSPSPRDKRQSRMPSSA